MRGARTLLPLLVALLCGAGGDPTLDPSESGDHFTGFLVAANAIDVYAPDGDFRMMGWGSSGGSAKLLELIEDGKPVKAGEVVARFEFRGRHALPVVRERIQRAEADAQQSAVTNGQKLEGLLLEKRRRELEAKLAQINVEKERAISKRQAELNRIARKIADFEVEAMAQRIDSMRESSASELSFQNTTVSRARGYLKRYEFYEKRMQLVAPGDGVVRHAFNSAEHRKIQKGDGIPCGQKVLSIAKDASLAARFFVPEHRASEVRAGMTVVVTAPPSKVEYRAVIEKMDFFPQELGFLMENPSLANGREKAIAVTARLEGTPSGLSAGTELRVKARAP